MEDRFQFLIHNAPAGPVREQREDAAQDAVLAGLATWVSGVQRISAIQWADRRASIVRLGASNRSNAE
jgi:hypothetical protein